MVMRDRIRRNTIFRRLHYTNENKYDLFDASYAKRKRKRAKNSSEYDAVE